MADGSQPAEISPTTISSTVGPVADSRYDQEITRDCEDCTSWVRVAAWYPDEWQTPMSDALFELRQNGEVLYTGRLHSQASLGIAPEAPLTREQHAELGSFTVPNVPPGPVVFTILPDGSEADVLRIEEEIQQLIAAMLAEKQAEYADEWTEWNEWNRLEKGSELLSSAFAGFTESVGTWWQEERGFWSAIGDFFAAAWDAIVDTLGDIATALHPSNLRRTAQAVWDGASTAANGLVEMIGDIPEAAREFYAGTVLIIENLGAITSFIGDFVAGDMDGVERFVTTTLPNLVEDSAELAEWQQMIRNNADAWQTGLEVLLGTSGPALLVAAVAGLCAAIPPQVWAESGIASVTIIAIELTISAIIGFLAGAATVVTGGAAVAAAGALLVGRAAKWARMGGRVLEQMESIMEKISEIISKIVQMGQAAVRARRWGTRNNGTRPGAAGQTTGQERREDDGRCRNCGERLGERGHPEREPTFRGGNTTKGGGYRTRILTATAANPSSIGSIALRSETQAHHLVSGEAMSRTGKASRYERLGYDINVAENLSLIPSNGHVACHLSCQLHLGNHAWGAYDYHNEVETLLGDVSGNLRSYCQANRNTIQADVDAISVLIARRITRFALPLTSVATDFARGLPTGCADAATVTGRGSRCSSRRNHSSQFNFGSLAIPYTIEAKK